MHNPVEQPIIRLWRNASVAVLLAGIALTGVATHAQDLQPPGLVFDGEARTGTDTRPVRFRFFCSSNNGPNVTGVLAVELEVPGYERLHAVFDFDPFEGPDANAGALTVLQADGARSHANGRFAAAGSVVPRGAAEVFALEVAASRREAGALRKVAVALRPLLDGPARLNWLQGNAKPGGTPIRAILELTQARSGQLKAALGPCLDAR